MSDKQVLAKLKAALNDDDAKAVIEHRKKTIKKPLTVRGAHNLALQFQKIDEHERSEAVNLMIDRCWQGFKAEWYMNQMPAGTSITSATRRLIAMRGANQKRLN